MTTVLNRENIVQLKHKHILGKDTHYDSNRLKCYDVDNPKYASCFSFVEQQVNDMFPITFPYKVEQYKVYYENFLCDEENGNFDTVGILYMIDSNDNKIDISKYYEADRCSFVEITKEEYEYRYQNRCLKE